MVTPNQLPGHNHSLSTTHRQIALRDEKFLEGGVILDGSNSRDPGNTPVYDLRSGIVLGKVTANGFYAPSILGVLTDAYDEDGASDASSDESSDDNLYLNVSAATATEIVRRIGASGTFKVVGPATAGGTVNIETFTFSAVNTTTGAITVTDQSVNFIAGSFIMPTDGSENPVGVLVGDGYGIRVVDHERDDDIDVTLDRFLIGGHVDASQLVNYPSDAAIKKWIKRALNGITSDGGTDTVNRTGGSFTFDDDY